MIPLHYLTDSLLTPSGRLCRVGQNKTPRAYIIGDKDFFGDKMAFEVKAQRAQEDQIMRRPFSALRQSAIEEVHNAVSALRTESSGGYGAWFKEEAKRAAEDERKVKRARQAAKLAGQGLSMVPPSVLQKSVNQ
jgi:hypothetical protein